jgi:hypothetical protein
VQIVHVVDEGVPVPDRSAILTGMVSCHKWAIGI